MYHSWAPKIAKGGARARLYLSFVRLQSRDRSKNNEALLSKNAETPFLLNFDVVVYIVLTL